jgi:hypothetical protein
LRSASRHLSGALLDRHDDRGALPAEPLAVQMLDELGQRCLHGSWSWLAIEPSFLGFKPSSRAIWTWA